MSAIALMTVAVYALTFLFQVCFPTKTVERTR